LKVKVDKLDLYDLSKVTDERVEDAVDAGRVDAREVERTERALRLTETLVHQTLTCCKTTHSDMSRFVVYCPLMSHFKYMSDRTDRQTSMPYANR